MSMLLNPGGNPEACEKLTEWLAMDGPVVIAAFNTKRLAKAWLKHKDIPLGCITFKRITAWYECTDG